MNIADLVIVLLLVGAAISGYRQGLVTALLTLVGAIGGALLGIKVAPLLADQLADSAAKVAIAIALVVAGVLLVYPHAGADAVGLVLLAAALASQRLRMRRERVVAAA